ncbi:hypothetical protein FISHEDRAFT_63466 [Fistulina hepatica ATCC 64428]|uniref:Conserved oligomeric Golgi complex subunit 5 n=1 Tax=Fistulina hepatica ATCC 64428 TaxID=1128425 RepID=A0A0D7AN61_9AGAR|nr:hypothetical protein FISHEDRAFT_63466 [Fistulina hepatica ATCC 64428]
MAETQTGTIVETYGSIRVRAEVIDERAYLISSPVGIGALVIGIGHVEEPLADYTVFADPDFDANEYANAILAGEPYPPSSDAKPPAKSAVESVAKEDISVAISKLTHGIDEVSKQIKNMVSSHHEDLLSQAAGAHELSGSLTSVRAGLDELDSSLEKLRAKIRVPYQSMQTSVTRLQKLQQASNVLRRTSRFVVLARRLQGQMTEMELNKGNQPSTPTAAEISTSLAGTDTEDDRERAVARAALSIAELDDQRESADAIIPLRAISAVAAHVAFIEDARATVMNEMENMVVAGLTSLNQSLLASSLQTAYNLGVLPELVQGLVTDLAQAVEERIRSTFDLGQISKDTLVKDSNASQSPTLYKSRIRTEPTNITAPQWTAALWSRLEITIEEMAVCCIKVYTLEKVLALKKDTVTQVVFLDEAMKLLENKPSVTFWTSLGRALERHARDAAKGSTFMQQTLGTGYPRLLRLFHQFFAKIAVHTDTVYTQNYQSPETVVVLRALSNFESLYLARSTGKLNETIGQVLGGGARTPPGMNEGVNVARTITNELDSARFDPLLVRVVAKNVASSLDMLLSRVEGLVIRDRSAITLIGPTATPQQVLNAQLVTFLYHCWVGVNKLKEEHVESVFNILSPGVQKMHALYERILDPLVAAIRRELGAIITRLHRINFGTAVDPMSGMGGASLYMKDLVDKLSFIRTELLSKFSIAEAGRAITISLVRFVIKTFLLHASIASPLGETGKLQLTSDMTELEFALNAFLNENLRSKRGGGLDSIGDEYKMLRAMRPLLFLDNAQLASRKFTAGLPPVIVLHHILVRSPIPLPHTLHGWQEAEYVRWVDEHSEEEAWTLIEGGLAHWEKMAESEGKDPKDAQEYIDLARTVLFNAQNQT